MARAVEIIISAVDQASRVFDDIAGDARRSFLSIERSISDVDQAIESLPDVDIDADVADVIADVERIERQLKGLPDRDLDIDVDEIAVVAAVNRVEKALRDMGDAAAEQSAKTERELQAIADEARNVERAVDGIDFGALGGGAALGGVSKSFNDVESSVGALQAELGVTKDVAEEFRGVAIDVYKNNLGDSLGEATQTVALLNRATGETGPTLENLAKDIFMVRDRFRDLGAEPREMTEALRTMSPNFPGATEAQQLDLIARSFQLGTGDAGDLLDTLNEYPGDFSRIGLNASDMFNILDGGMDAGARNTDVLANAVRELGTEVTTTGTDTQKAIREMFPKAEADRIIKDFASGGEAGRDAFYKILEGVNSIKDPQKKANTQFRLFRSIAEDNQAALDRAIPKWLETKDATQEVADTTDSLSTQYDTTGGHIQGFIREHLGGLMEKFSSLDGSTQGLMQPLAGLGGGMLILQGFGIDFGKIFGGLGTKVINLGKDIFGFFKGGGKGATGLLSKLGVFGRFLGGPWGAIIITAILLIVDGVDWLIENWETVGPVFEGAWNDIKTTVLPLVKDIVEWIKTTFSDLKTWWDDTWEGLKPAVERLSSFLGATIGLALLVLVQLFRWVWPLISSIVETAWELIKSVISGALKIITGVIGFFVDLFTGDWKGMWENIKRICSGVWDIVTGLFKASFVGKILGFLIDFGVKVFNKTKETWNSIKTTISNKVSEAWQWVKDKFTAMKNDATTKFEGILSSARSKFTAVKNAIMNPITSAKDWVKKKIGEIKGFFTSLKLKIPTPSLPKLPHFNLTYGSKTLMGKTISYPTGFNVNWYAKGGVFAGPSVIGVGEKGPEAVVPLSGPRMGPFADAIARRINVNRSNDSEVIQVNINGPVTIQSDDDIKKVAKALQPLISKEMYKVRRRESKGLGG
ncbi:phage tail tape measure protein [Hazenella sp. IB182357]|uniref:Phage tail tape measure protein n=1 Tax=Polycladospora coralii TaxID=2771432 RepID=A0A926NBW0_9BACL|nr:phage tail tape measure protein [Polycladospora coralii]MBD1373748.1 phage tail tape measure protein [Polycladospora coralii]